MLFYEKLDFLLRLTDTSNKQLAIALSVDPSLISRMRSGKRSLPKVNDYAHTMSTYFAKKCTSDYIRLALSEAIGQKQIKLIMKTEMLADIINQWLMDASPSAFENMQRVIHEKALNIDNAKHPIEQTELNLGEKKNCYTYYGNSGKRQAFHNFALYLMKRGTPRTILIATDESLEWAAECPAYREQIRIDLLTLAQAGYSFRRIAPKYVDTDEAVAAFTRWLPIYMQGKMETYYYPRIRDNVFHRTIMAVPGLISLCSSSVGYQIDNNITFLYIDPEISRAAAAEFSDYFKKCIPMATAYTHSSPDKTVLQRLVEYLDIPGIMATKFYGLPALVTPASIIKKLFGGDNRSISTFKLLDQKCHVRLAKDSLTDVISLADPNDVRDGKVLCTTSLLVPGVEPYFYTIPEYIEHLEEVLSLMDTYPDYTVIIYENTAEAPSTICTIEGGICYIIRMEEPVTLFEVSDQNIVASAKDYILNLVDIGQGNRSVQRAKTIEKIRTLINELKDM